MILKDLMMIMKGQVMSNKIRFVNLLDADEEMKWQVRAWRNNDFVRRNMLSSHIISESEHEKFLSKLQKDDAVRYYIAFYDDEPIGVLNMHIDFYGRKSEFGYYLSNIKYVDSGFGAVLEYVLLNHAFYELKLETVFCRTLLKNKKVVALHKRFGFDEMSQDGEICFQSISVSKWIDKRKHIENIIGSIFPLQEIGGLL